MAPTRFPLGYHALHRDASMNFQMNRWYGWVGEPAMLEEMRGVAPRIESYVDWKREFLALAEGAARQGHVLRSGYYYRAAEFFMRADDPGRKGAREKFLAAVRSVHGLEQAGRHEIPYVDDRVKGFLPAYRFTPAQSKGTIVFFGGFDSYIEELTPAFLYLRDAGYEVVAFEGPGQGAALNDAGIPMTADWHKPVKAVLDHFRLDRVTLAGLSMGGCLVIRAAAFEPRVERVIAYDIFTNFLEINFRQLDPLRRGLLRALLRMRAAALVNALVNRVARKSPVAEWGIHEGMHVTGTSTPYEFFRKAMKFHTADVSGLVTQDVLLLAGREDHYVPVEQFHRQIRMLTHARSITARMFTEAQSAGNHCQAGNYGLAFGTIVAWLDGMQAPP
jgi:pimeloyl-ACP methyl ester carboxylesterase